MMLLLFLVGLSLPAAADGLGGEAVAIFGLISLLLVSAWVAVLRQVAGMPKSWLFGIAAALVSYLLSLGVFTAQASDVEGDLLTRTLNCAVGMLFAPQFLILAIVLGLMLAVLRRFWLLSRAPFPGP